MRANSDDSRAYLRPAPKAIEARIIMRLEGDSIAFFWALETETAISYEMLIALWREFADVLTDSWHAA